MTSPMDSTAVTDALGMLMQQMQTITEALGTVNANSEEMRRRLNDLEAKKTSEEPIQTAVSVTVAEERARQAADELRKARRESRGFRATPQPRSDLNSTSQSTRTQYDSDSDDEDLPDISDDVYKKSKAVFQHISATEVKGKDSDFSRTITTLKTAFKNARINKIMMKDDRKWHEYAQDDDNKKSVAIMESVLMQTLESTLKTNGHALTAFNSAKSAKLTPRQTWIAIRDSRKLSTVKLTKRKIKKQLRAVLFQEGNYGRLLQQLNDLWDQLADLEDPYTGISLAISEPDKVEVIMYKLEDSQQSLPEEQQTWAALFEARILAFDQSLTELDLAALHTVVRPRLEAAKMRKVEGAVMAQTGNNNNNNNNRQEDRHARTQEWIKTAECNLCHKIGHLAYNCPDHPVEDQVCVFHLHGKCKHGEQCKRKHNGKAATNTNTNTDTNNNEPKLTKQQWYDEIMKSQAASGVSNSQQRHVDGVDDGLEVHWHTGFPDPDGVMPGGIVHGKNRAQVTVQTEDRAQVNRTDVFNLCQERNQTGVFDQYPATQDELDKMDPIMREFYKLEPPKGQE